VKLVALILQRPCLAIMPLRARKQTEKQDVEADLAADVLPADLQKLSKLAKVRSIVVLIASTPPAAPSMTAPVLQGCLLFRTVGCIGPRSCCSLFPAG
jgi:hypothetical protein